MTAQRYRKKPIVIEAMRWDGTVEGATPIIGWVLAGGGTARYVDDPPTLHSTACRCDGYGFIPGPLGMRSPHQVCPETLPTGGGPSRIAVDTPDATGRVFAGDWLIHGAADDWYPCKGDIFDATYEPEETTMAPEPLVDVLRDIDPNPEAPGPRPFILVRDVDETGVSGTGRVAEGVEFSDGIVALRWCTEWPTSVVFHERGMASVEAVHGHGGKTRVVWL